MSFRRHSLDPAVHGMLTLADEVPDQRGNVIPALAQRWQADGKHIQAVVQIVAKCAFRDGFLQIPMRRGDDSDVDLSSARRPQAFELAFLQHAKQFRLQIERQIANFVEKQRPAVGQLESALALRHGPGECAALVTEQLALDQRRRECGTVDRHQSEVPSSAARVQLPGEQLLAGAGLAEQQHRAVARGDLVEPRQRRAQRRTAAHDFFEGRDLHRPMTIGQTHRVKRPVDRIDRVTD